MDTDLGLFSAVFQLIESRPELKEVLLSIEVLADQELVNEKLGQLVAYLESIPRTPQRLPVRIYMAACLDIIHSGHFNCMRQSKALGDVLVLGVIADEEILRCKGPPVMKQFERKAIAEACKWVDEVIDGVPYYVIVDLLNKYNCDYVVHGDDVAIRKDTGTDAYEGVRNAKKLKIVKRTEGILTTEMVGKMLLITGSEVREAEPEQVSNLVRNTKSSFLATTRMINQFSTAKVPQPGQRIVYIDGSFDLLHVGHLETLKRAKAMGDYLIVGIHDDKTVHGHKGKNYPIMNLHERTLNLLALKYVDDVIMGAPWEITEDMIKTLNITIVVQGTHHKDSSDEVVSSDAYRVPKELGIYQEIESAFNLTTDDIVRRIVDNRMLYIQRNTRMTANENKYYENKAFIQEL